MSESKNSSEAFLAFANLQMAAEAFWVKQSAPPAERFSIKSSTEPVTDLIATLTEGNDHASKFTETQAREFAANWKVVAHIGNTTTGFSGTVFEALKPNAAAGIAAGDQVVSFRSTEFIDDAARDNQATNALEIAEKGFAFGQIADMADWVRELQADGVLKDSIKVTGYSLGGHLATAFNLLQQGGAFDRGEDKLKIEATYTFNGAGVGRCRGQI